MNFLKLGWYHLTGKVYLVERTIQKKGLRILHVSDTPSQFYPELARLIKQLSPDYIIHTGDLVDNIKLERTKVGLTRYYREVNVLKRCLSIPTIKGVFISLGNHDDSKYIHEHFIDFTITDTFGVLEICGHKIAYSHYVDQLTNVDADLCLYGHDMDREIRAKHFLNGITDIHIIDLEPLHVVSLPYPMGVDDARLRRSKYGF